MFNSYRLMVGEVGRSVAAYAGSGVYLDVALGWVAGTPVTAPVSCATRESGGRGTPPRSLMSHFWRMVLTRGTRALRIVSGSACFRAARPGRGGGPGAQPGDGTDLPQGWTSLIVVTLLCTGAILFSLGVIAEYLGVSVNMAMGRPLYLITGDPALGPLGRDDEDG